RAANLFDSVGRIVSIHKVGPKLLVLLRAVRVSGVKEPPAKVHGAHKSTGHRNAISMNIEHREEDANAHRLRPQVWLINGLNMCDDAVGRADDRFRIIKNNSVRIAKEPEHFQPKKYNNRRCNQKVNTDEHSQESVDQYQGTDNGAETHKFSKPVTG